MKRRARRPLGRWLDGDFGRAAGVLCAVLATALAGCPASTPSPAVAGRQSAPAVKVERARSRPALTVVERRGDPLPALALAADTRLGPIDNSLLAALLQERLERAGHEVTVVADGLSVRVSSLPAELDAIGGLLDALRTAAVTPLGQSDTLPGARARLAGLAQQPLDHPALLPAARCSGDALVPAKEVPNARVTTAKLRQRTEKARRLGLSYDRMAVAVVGSAEAGEAARDALRSIEGWPRNDAPEQSADDGNSQGSRRAGGGNNRAGGGSSRASRDSSHRVYARPAASPRLDVALQVADARDAAAFVAHAAPQLKAKLAVVAPQLELTELRATARHRGGCIRAGLSAPRELPSSEEVAAATQLLRAEVASPKPWPTAAQASLSIAAAPRAEDAAARAAWWALSHPGEPGPAIISSAWGVPAQREPALDPEQLQARYRTQLAAAAEVTAEPAVHRQRTEPGQARIWVLVGNRCGVARETDRDAGLAALTALSMTHNDDDGVRIEPYASSYGVGVIASGPAADLDAAPRWLASRVGNAAGETLMTPPGAAAVAEALERWRLLRAGSEARAQRDLAAALLPGHPSHLLAWAGTLDMPPPAQDMTERWHELVRGPLHIAVLAPSETQASAALQAAEQWLLPASQRSRCAAAVPAATTATAAAAAKTPAKSWWLGVRLGPKQEAWGQLTASLIEQPDGPLNALASGGSIDATLVGGGGSMALVVHLRSDKMVDARALQQAIDAAAGSPPSTAQLERAQADALRRHALSRRHPRARLEALWSDQRPATAQLDGGAYGKWLKKLYSSKRWALVPEG